MKALTGGWSKYGGSKQHVIKETLTTIWSCQSCGMKQPATLTPYLKEFLPGEYLRVCATCTNNDCEKLKKRRYS